MQCELSDAIYTLTTKSSSMKINQLLLFPLFLCFSFYVVAQDIDACDPCQPPGFNLLWNGDFELGNTEFSSDLTYDPAGGCALNQYSIFDFSTTNCQGNDQADHTSGTGNYMYVNLGLYNDEGSSNDGVTIWSKDTLLLEDQQYSFSFWVYSASVAADIEPTLEAKIGGSTIGATTSLNDSPLSDGGWQEFCFDYLSEAEGTTTISIAATYPESSGTENTEFYLDDISLNPIYPDAIPCELIVQYEPGTTQERKDSIRASFDITVQDSCVCGNIDLWLINQFPMVVNGDTITDIERLKRSSKDSADVQDVDYNYTTQNHSSKVAQTTTSPLKAYDNYFAPNSDDSCAIVVAVIDTGIDEDHEFFNDPQYYPDNLWSFNNPCPDDGTSGYNFYDNNDVIDDDGINGHGSHVSGIVVQQFNDNFTSFKGWNLELMPIKSQNAQGRGTLFKVICSTLFAVDNGADVINMSFGYRGDSTAILYNAIEKGLLDNEVIVVASAGNDARNNDLYGHYPSNLTNENLIAVAADTLGENSMNSITEYSCFGANSVDISVFGSINSSVPPSVDNTDETPNDGFTTLQGTSMAAPQIAAAAAIGKAYMNSASAIKAEILSAGDSVNVSGDTVSMTALTFDMVMYTQGLTNEQACSTGNNPPVASLVATPSSGAAPLTVNFDGSGSVDPDNDNLTYFWDFGDGLTGTGVTISHTYANIATYTATLTVDDGNGATNQASVTIDVTQPCFPPSVFVATPQSTTSALATWDETPAATFYQVRYRIKGTTAWKSAGTSNLQRVLNNLTPNKYYQYKMRSQCAGGVWSGFTEIKEFYSSACPMPTGIASVYLDENRMRLRWDNVGAAVNRIKYRAVGTSNWLFKNSLPGNNYVYITGLEANTTYEYRIRARCNDGTWSAFTDKYFHTTSAPKMDVSESTSSSKLFPNPTSGVLNVSFDVINDDDVRFVIRDVLGKIIIDESSSYDKGSQMVTINVKGLDDGYYFLSIYKQGEVETLRFMKL